MARAQEHSILFELCFFELCSPLARGLGASVKALFLKRVLCDSDSTPVTLEGRVNRRGRLVNCPKPLNWGWGLKPLSFFCEEGGRVKLQLLGCALLLPLPGV